MAAAGATSGGGGGRRSALVTGSSNGIGEAIVKALAKLDFQLVVTGRNLDDIRRVADECAELSPSRARPLELAADLENESEVRRLFNASLEHFGGRLDLLVNNAGYSRVTPLNETESSWSNYLKTIQVNLNSAFLLTLLAMKPLQETARDQCAGAPTSVVNISSIAAEHPLEDYAYCVSKSGLCMLTTCLAGHLGPLVRVNCLNPGPIETKIVERAGLSLDQFRAIAQHTSPLRRTGLASEVADAVLFLADSSRAGFITGAQLTVDGGVTSATIKI